MSNRVSKYPFEKDSIERLKEHPYGSNWPVVYILENGEEAYVGETISATRRTQDHLDNQVRDRFNTLCLIADHAFNKSATLDLESKLIEYIAADDKYILQNSNRGMRNHDYFEKQRYQTIFEEVWGELRAVQFTSKTLQEIRNSDLFKFSPYKSLTADQGYVVDQLEKIILNQPTSTSIVQGEPGSGKTILAVYLAKYLSSCEGCEDFKIGIVLPQTALRGTVKKIFKHVKGLKANMVMGPSQVVDLEGKGHYDLLIVDEAHRLSQRRNLSSYTAFDKTSEALGLDPLKATQLDWIKKSAKHVVLLYDSNQSVKPSDVDKGLFDAMLKQSNFFKLTSQLRALAGDGYTTYLESILRGLEPTFMEFHNYELRLFNSLSDMIDKIEEQETVHGLSRLVAGYAWDWKTKKNPNGYDIILGKVKLRWNSTISDWINSENAVQEVGCIHTVQGYDLNYTGVIIGPELTYADGQLKFHIERYKDRYGKHTQKTELEMLSYIINIYKTLMTRGIKGTYIYACDPGLSDYLARFIKVAYSELGEVAAEKE